MDSYRPSYGRYTVSRPRTCVFVGTTNESQYLADSTGARRFWPVAVTRLDAEALRRDRDQIWAEAVHYYSMGEQWWPHDESSSMLAEAQEERATVDAWEARIDEWARGRSDITTADIMGSCLDIEPGRWDRATQSRVGHCLRRLGYVTQRVRRNGQRVRIYEKS